MTPLNIGYIMSLDPGIVSSMIGFGTGLINYGTQAGMSQADRNFARKMSDLAYERNIALWNMQNEYNLPVNQYQRQLEGLRTNGLNPNLVYGGSSSIGGAAGPISPYKFDSYHSTSVPQFRGNPIQDLLSTRLLQTQIAGQEANNRLTNARAKNEEDRNPGIIAKSDEASTRWQYILNNLDDQESAWRAEQALTYWKSQASFSTAEILKNKASISYYQAAMAEWLNTTEIEGLGMTYQQYMESCKAMLPGVQYEKFKADILDIASRIAYRAEQGELVRLKQEYQGYLNRLAKYGRALGNDWVTLLLSGLQELWPSFGFGPGNPGPLYKVMPGLYEKNPVERGMSTGSPND